MDEPTIINSLSKEKLAGLLVSGGLQAIFNYLRGTIETGYSVNASLKVGKAADAQREAFESFESAIPEFLKIIEQKEIRVSGNTFNLSAAFVTSFQYAAAGAVSLGLLEISRAIARVGSSLEDMKADFAVGVMKKLQGWGDDGFGSFIHSFLRNEMRAHNTSMVGENTEKHFFYLWHTDDTWYPRFEEKCRQQPLGPNFGGYSTDLSAICLWMARNRLVLRLENPNDEDAIFHLVIPAYEPIVMDHPVIFHRQLGPLVITGQRHRGTDLVWFNMPHVPNNLTLKHVGNLYKARSWTLVPGIRYGACGFVAGWFGMAAAATGLVSLGPLAPFVAPVAISSWCVGFASGMAEAGIDLYEGLCLSETRILGDPALMRLACDSGGLESVVQSL